MTANRLAVTVPRTQSELGALAQAVSYVRSHTWTFVALSAMVVIPCSWHRHIEAGDLGSHTYNAWLVQLIKDGQVPGLWINHLQLTNVLFDVLLSGCTRALGYSAGEKASASVAVLIFVWGAFALMSAASRHAPWRVFALLAMLAYGWTFQMGFFNYYISLGLSFFALALFWRGSGWERWLSLALLPLITVAHPLGALLLLGAGAYLELGSRIRLRTHVGPFLAITICMVAIHRYLFHRFDVGTAATYPLYFFNGVDQLVIYGRRYQLLAVPAIVLCTVSILSAFVGGKDEVSDWRSFAIWMELYVLAEIGIFLMPDSIHFRHVAGTPALLTERATSVSAVLICCALMALPAKRWSVIGWAAIAALFFVFLYQDTGTIDHMEAQAEKLVRTIPHNSRVITTILKPPGSRARAMETILDRACIGRCFSYANYEAATEQFRVRAQAGNPYVLTDYSLIHLTQLGSYIVQDRDLPLYQLYQCSPRWTDLCITPLKGGQRNDFKGVYSPSANLRR